MTDRDELIAGWLDGTLAPDEAATFEAEMAQDESLAELVGDWRRNDDLLRAAFSAPMEQPVNDDLLRRMGLDQPTVGPGAANDNRPWRWVLGVGGSVAAAALLVVTVGGPLTTRPDAASQLAEAMERLPSTQATVLADGGRVSPVLSFRTADGRYCREFAVSGGPKPGGGIACRSDGRWSVEVRTAVERRTAAPGEIATAGARDHDELAAAYARLGASDPLSVEAERALIAARWRQR